MRTITSRGHHDAWVTAWLARVAKSSEPTERHALFHQAFAALWRCALPMLGDFTLSAIVERALSDATERYPQLLSLRIEATGSEFRLVGESGSGACGGELAEALRFLLVELLAALGALTGEAMSPALHQELARSVPPRSVPPRSRVEARA